MSNTAEAKAAIKALNGFILNGQPISVEVCLAVGVSFFICGL
jgi:RNA recognition motif-containing protein